jgi:Predicted membrane protein
MFGYESWSSNFFGCGMGWWSSGWWVLCLVFMILIMGSCFFFMISMIRHRKGNMMFHPPLFQKCESTNHTASDSAKDILDKRYAAGEISTKEYAEKKRDIS